MHDKHFNGVQIVHWENLESHVWHDPFSTKVPVKHDKQFVGLHVEQSGYFELHTLQIFPSTK